MGHSWVYIEVSGIERKRSKKVKALVDTGATSATVPKKLAEELEIQPTGGEQVSTRTGMINISRGEAWIKVNGKQGPFSILHF